MIVSHPKAQLLKPSAVFEGATSDLVDVLVEDSVYANGSMSEQCENKKEIDSTVSWITGKLTVSF